MIHHVYANQSNVGDWLAARGMQRLLAPRRVAEHFCDDGFVAPTLAALARLGPQDLVVIGGGGLFMDYFAPFWEGLLPLTTRVRCCLWGVGFCDLKAEPSHPPLDVVRAVVARSLLTVVRDELTRSHLGDPTLPRPVACPSVMEVEPQPRGWGVLHVDNYTTVGAAAFDAMDAACRDFASRTGRPCRRTNNRVGRGREGELAQCLAQYARSDLVVSSALHGCVIAVAMERPVLAVSGDRKIDAFMAAAGLRDWVVDHADLAALPSRLAGLAQQPPARTFVARTREGNRCVAAQIAALASELATPVAGVRG